MDKFTMYQVIQSGQCPSCKGSNFAIQFYRKKSGTRFEFDCNLCGFGDVYKETPEGGA